MLHGAMTDGDQPIITASVIGAVVERDLPGGELPSS
jgi:hypothetical protein